MKSEGQAVGKRGKVVVGMSGGVDSSVAAALLVRQGYEVTGVTLETWKETGEIEQPWLDRSCCKIGLARHVADRLGIPYQVVDAQGTFRRVVIQNFLDEYARGRTPNPCVLCNEKIKFGLLLEIARDLGADYLATGHYAKVEYSPQMGSYLLKKGADRLKDQSYFLYRLSQEQLSRILFPLGNMEKRQVWEIAEGLGLPVDQVAESQEICFVTQGDYRVFLEEWLTDPLREGEVVDAEGRVLGHHKGVAFYTIGQRRGLGLSATKLGMQDRLYVTGLDAGQNRVVVGSETDLYHVRLTACRVNLIQGTGLESGEGLVVTAKIRYRMPEAEAVVTLSGEDCLEVVFQQPQRAITPGQSVVLYQEDVVIGGGIIDRVYCS